MLDAEIKGATLGEGRAGHALAHATLAAVDVAGVLRGGVRIGIQGFGTLARSAALSLAESGHTPVAISDEHTCLHRYDDELPATGGFSGGPSAGRVRVPVDVEAPQRLFELPLDVLVLAACENSVSVDDAERLKASVVVVGSLRACFPPHRFRGVGARRSSHARAGGLRPRDLARPRNHLQGGRPGHVAV